MGFLLQSKQLFIYRIVSLAPGRRRTRLKQMGGGTQRVHLCAQCQTHGNFQLEIRGASSLSKKYTCGPLCTLTHVQIHTNITV